MNSLTTQDIAKAGRTTVRGVHVWDAKGLLGEVERDEHGARIFGAKHIRRAREIAAGQMAGMSLAEIGKGVDPTRIFEAVDFMMQVGGELAAAGYDLWGYDL